MNQFVCDSRVEFTLPGSVLSREKEGYAQLLAEVFGIPRPTILSHANGRNDMIIVCRPSQFTDFIISRCDMGLSNNIMILNARIFVPETKHLVYDVSNQKARIG